MEQLHQMARAESESFTELPSYLKEKLDFGDDFDLFSPGPASGPGDFQTGGLQHLGEPQLLLSGVEQYALSKICDRSPCQRIKALNYLENITEEASYELDSSKFTERLESFNELDQYSCRIMRESRDCVMTDIRNSKHNGNSASDGLEQFIKILPSPKSMALPQGSNRFVLPLSVSPENNTNVPEKSIDAPAQGIHLSPESRPIERDIQPSLQFMRQSRSREDKALAENEIEGDHDSSDQTNDFEFQIKKIPTSNSEKDYNYAGVGTETNLKSTINIYQRNNIVINISNDNSKMINAVKKSVSNSLTKNFYYDLQKFPNNAFSKKKAEPHEPIPDELNVKTKQLSTGSDTISAKVSAPPEKKRGSKLKTNDRSEPVISLNLEKKYRNSKLLHKSSPESESICNLMMNSDYFSNVRKLVKPQKKVLDHFASTHVSDGFTCKSLMVNPIKNLDLATKLGSQEDSSKILRNLYKDPSSFAKKPSSTAKTELPGSQSNLKQPCKENKYDMLKKLKELKEVHETTLANISQSRESRSNVLPCNPAKRVSAIVTANVTKKTSHRSKSITPSDSEGLLLDGKYYSKKSQFGVPLQTQSQILKPLLSESVPLTENPSPLVKTNFGSASSKFFNEKFISLASSQTFLNCGVPNSLQNSAIVGKTNAPSKDNNGGRQPLNLTRESVDFLGVGSITLFRTGVFENQLQMSRRSKTKGGLRENTDPELRVSDKNFKEPHVDSTASLLHSKVLRSSTKTEQVVRLKGALELSRVGEMTKNAINFMPSNPDLQKILVDNQRIYNKAKKILRH